MKNIGLVIPVIDSVPVEAFGAHLTIAAEIAKHHRVYIFVPSGIMPHDAARIRAFDDVLDVGCEYLMFVDDDTIVPQGGFTHLLEVMEDRKPAVVSGYYRRRGFPYTPVWSKKSKNKFYQADAESGVHEIDCSGLGCALIDVMWVYENLKKPYFEMIKDPIRGTTVTDDVTFFRKVRAKKGVVLGDASVRCSHVGSRIIISEDTEHDLRVIDTKALTRLDSYKTHRGVLRVAVEHTDGDVLELGVGEGSTPFLHGLCKERRLLSLENSVVWLDKYKHLESSAHELKLLTNDNLFDFSHKQIWDLVFVDIFSEGTLRAECGREFIDSTNVMVIHDSEWEPLRELAESFKYVYTDKSIEPHTSVCSNKVNVSQWFEKGD